MLSILRKFINMFHSGNNSSEDNSEISVGVQPTINMPRCSDLSYNPDDKIIEEFNSTNQFSFHHVNIVDLNFSIDYKISTCGENFEIEDKYNVKDLKITLIKFARKACINEEYDETRHKPQTISLPVGSNAKHGFYIFYDKSFISTFDTDTKSTTQYISLYSGYNNQIETRQDIKDILGRLRQLFGLGINDKRYAFRFHVGIEKYSTRETPHEDSETIDVYTDLFKLSFGLGDSFVETKLVEEKYYHIPVDYKDKSGSDEDDELTKTSDIIHMFEGPKLDVEETNCCVEKKSEEEGTNCCAEKKSEEEAKKCHEYEDKEVIEAIKENIIDVRNLIKEFWDLDQKESEQGLVAQSEEANNRKIAFIKK